ncbi:hypothetical protein Tsubulata_039597 [Turnera subulata]|uniref:Nucleolar protein 14 n=1 Tax=Turnera subulata TaxID=218843 RepID=A0A9Q0FEL8_9ROSI|nr:hypothetical protein Tsubulata_039597 [Turnera subulata]
MGKKAGKPKSKSKSKKSGPEAVAMKVKATKKENPFETIWSRRKFDILGKKRKGEQLRVGLSRSLAIQKRNKTLLKDYQQSTKSSVFVDKRIGEQNDGLPEFDKAIMRSQRELQVRMKKSKKSKYNLSDGEEDDDGLEFPGGFSGNDDFEDEMLSDDADPDDETHRSSAGLRLRNVPYDPNQVDEKENRPKTKKEVMEEVMLKSKFFKAQKAKDKEEKEKLVEELDKTFASLLQSQVLSTLTEPGKINASKTLADKGSSNEHPKNELLVTQQPGNIKQESDFYDKIFYEMAADVRAQPSERTKTQEEIDQMERERLEQLEEERQKRMLAIDDSGNEEDDDEIPTQKVRPASGDDHGDSFSVDEEPRTKKGWIDEILERENTDDSENEDDGSSEDSENSEEDGDDEGSDEEDSADENDKLDKTQSLKEWEQSDDDSLDTDLEDHEEDDYPCSSEEEQMNDINLKRAKKNNAIKTMKEDKETTHGRKIKENCEQRPTQLEIPYVIEAPKNLEELCAIFGDHSNDKIIEIITRIRKNNAITLAAENRRKMQVFYGVLLQYFAILANKKPLNLELLNLLVEPLIEISIQIPYFSAICARQRILRTRTQFCEAIKNPENGCCWPSMKTLSLLRLWSMIFPCSDFRHVVMTPAILLMCEYLMRCPILSGRDAAIGSFLCSIVLQVSKQSQKFCPEAIMFLWRLLMAATDRKPASCLESEFSSLIELKELGPLLHIHNHVNEISPLNFLMVIDMPEDASFFSSDAFRAGVLVTVSETLRGFVDIYKGLSSFPEIFIPISMLLIEVAQEKNMPGALQEKFRDVAESIKNRTEELHLLRQPLQMRKQKPVPIKLLNPKFEENFVKGRDYDPDRERAERKKLKKLLKREAKGAARELRKDSAFLFEVKEKERALLEEERAEKYGKARAFLQEQEHAFKSGQLGKGKKRRR